MHVNDLYAEVTSRVVASLESGNLPAWHRPWSGGSGGFLPLRHNGLPYRGVNVLWLWSVADSKGFTSPYWMTFNQARELGGRVRKGEKSTSVIWCEAVTLVETAEDGTESESKIWARKTYPLFNSDQIDGLPQRYTVQPVYLLDPAQKIEHAETFVRNTGADIRHGSSGAFYKPSEDFISLPAFESFNSPEAYYGTCCHELAHWTGHASRLNRPMGSQRKALDYAKEEITAELASSYLAAQLGIAPPSIEQNAAYLEFWIKAMLEDSRYIFTAAAAAQRACDFLNSLQPFPA